jgi:hypothetical protein
MLPSFDDNANRKTDALRFRRLPTPSNSWLQQRMISMDFEHCYSNFFKRAENDR